MDWLKRKEGEEMTRLALDQSTSKTGWCITMDGEIVDSGCIDLHKIKDTELRMKKMYEEIVNLGRTYHVEYILIEDTQYQSNAQSYKLLCRLRGMIESYCYGTGVEIKVVKPTEWRKKLGFRQGSVKREELKKQAVDYVKRNIEGNYVCEDECEAICIWCSELEKVGV